MVRLISSFGDAKMNYVRFVSGKEAKKVKAEGINEEMHTSRHNSYCLHVAISCVSLSKPQMMLQKFCIRRGWNWQQILRLKRSYFAIDWLEIASKPC